MGDAQPDILQLIDEAIAGYNGDDKIKEFRLSNCCEEGWLAEVGNSTCPSVQLGEVDGDFRGTGATPMEAMQALVANVRVGKRRTP